METDDDPLVMYLVVRRRTTRPFAELATAAAVATRRCAARYRDDDRWRDGFEDWWRDSFRKVCLRAEPREWEACRDARPRAGRRRRLPSAGAASARDRVLVRMQALSDEAGALPASPATCRSRALTLVVATDLGMSAGKTLAQIGHAALMADLDPGTRRSRRRRGRRVADGSRADAVAIVRDGGLTELEPGSETVLVLCARRRDG